MSSPGQSPSAVTLRTIGERAGVSVSTVSAVLGRRKTGIRISPETEKRIVAIAEELNYQPNVHARALRSDRTQTVGMIFPNRAGSPTAPLLLSIGEEFTAKGYTQYCCISDDQLQREREHVEELRRRKVDGILLFAVTGQSNRTLERDHLRKLKEDRIPVVLVGPEVAGGLPLASYDDAAGGRLAVEHLVGLGHTRIACIDIPTEDPICRRRVEGYRQALRERGIEIRDDYIVKCPRLWEGGRELARRLMRLPEPPTAIFATDDTIAMQAIEGVTDASLEVPGDVAVIGMGNCQEAERFRVPVTVVGRPHEELGKKAARLLLQIIERPGLMNERPEVWVSPYLVVRSSCGARTGRT
jgi:DNA-binding LacI/PurR family transcriptional regulator